MPYLGSPTRRAYTLQLSGITRGETSWRDQIWKTHQIVNRGTKVFGDLWLTIRGGLSSALASQIETQKNRRILLALGWLSLIHI